MLLGRFTLNIFHSTGYLWFPKPKTTFYPYTYLNNSSSLLIYVLSISPVTPAAVIAQTLFGLPGIPFNAWMLEFSFSVLILETVVFFAIAKYLIRWREN